MSENQKQEDKIQTETSKSTAESSATEDSEGAKSITGAFAEEGTTDTPEPVVTEPASSDNSTNQDNIETKQDSTASKNNGETSTTSTPSLRKISFALIATPYIFAFCLTISTTLAAKIIIWFIGHTIGIAEEGETLIYHNVNGGSVTGMFICFVTPYAFKLLKALDVEMPKNINLKSIKYGALLGATIFVTLAFFTAFKIVGENSYMYITQAIYTVGILCGACSWEIFRKIASKLFQPKEGNKK